jgi:hypothetical protein
MQYLAKIGHSIFRYLKKFSREKWPVLARDCRENQPKIPAVYEQKL